MRITSKVLRFKLWAWVLLPLVASGRMPDFLERHMMTDVDACQDFYEHACGNWAQAHEDDEYSVQAEQPNHLYLRRLANLLRRRPSDDQPRFVHLLQYSFTACLAHQKPLNATQFVRWLQEWNALELEPKDRRSRRLVRLLKLCGLSPLLQYEIKNGKARSPGEAEQWLLALWPTVADDDDDADANKAQFFLPLTRAEFLKLNDALQLPGQIQWIRVKQLEIQLVRCVPAQGVRLDEVEQEVELMKSEPWLLPLPYGVALGAKRLQSYLPCLSAALAVQPEELVAAYLQLRLLRLMQLRPAAPRDRLDCAAQVQLLMTHAAAWLLQQQQTQLQRHQRNVTLLEMFEQLRSQFRQRLLANRNGFTSTTQRFLLDKLKGVRLRLGVLPEGSLEQQRQQLDRHYASLRLNAWDYYGNLLALLNQTQRWANEEAARERQTGSNGLYLVQSDGFGSNAIPFFLTTHNLVVLPDALLASSLFRLGQPEVYAYSGLGFLLGHELSHSFTPADVLLHVRNIHGIRHEMRSNLRYVNQTRCLKREYAKVASEKFCDLNGMDLAHAIYRRADPSHGRETQRIFFLNFAQYFCGIQLQDEDSRSHGSNRQRVNNAVASIAAFAHVFGCEGAPTQQPCELY